MLFPLVLKFGGSSVADPQRILNAARIIKERSKAKRPICVVVSAPADITDDLLVLAKDICGNKDPKKLCPRELDLMLVCGEQVGVALMCFALKLQGLKPYGLLAHEAGIVARGRYFDAEPIKLSGKNKIFAAFRRKQIVVVAGYQGVHEKTGDLVTLGRGGSDLTAVFLAAELKASHCEFYKDTPGVMSEDPRISAVSEPLKQLPILEMERRAQAGVQVLEKRSVTLARQRHVPIRVLSALDPSHPGTSII